MAKRAEKKKGVPRACAAALEYSNLLDSAHMLLVFLCVVGSFPSLASLTFDLSALEHVVLCFLRCFRYLSLKDYHRYFFRHLPPLHRILLVFEPSSSVAVVAVVAVAVV